MGLTHVPQQVLRYMYNTSTEQYFILIFAFLLIIFFIFLFFLNNILYFSKSNLLQLRDIIIQQEAQLAFIAHLVFAIHIPLSNYLLGPERVHPLYLNKSESNSQQPRLKLA